MIKAIRSFVGYVGFYRRFIKDFEKDVPFVFSPKCEKASKILKEKLTNALIMVTLDWNLPFELICDAIGFVMGAVHR